MMEEGEFGFGHLLSFLSLYLQNSINVSWAFPKHFFNYINTTAISVKLMIKLSQITKFKFSHRIGSLCFLAVFYEV